MAYHSRVLMVIPIGGADGRKYLDVVTDLVQDPPDPGSDLVAEIKRWATDYRDKHFAGRELRYDWETTAKGG